MAAAAPNLNADTEALVSIFEEIRRSSDNPEVQNAATLFIIILQSSIEDLVKEQPETNEYLHTHGYTQTQNENVFIQGEISYAGLPVTNNIRKKRIQNRQNTRYVYSENLLQIYYDFIPILKELQPLYSRSTLIYILSTALQNMVDNTGNKFFFNRLANFKNIMRMCINYHGIFTDNEIKTLVTNLNLKDIFSYYKDLVTVIHMYNPEILQNAEYIKILKDHPKYEIPTIEIFKRMYEYDKTRMHLLDAQKVLLQNMKFFLDNLQEQTSIEFVFSKLIPEDELQSFFDLYNAIHAEKTPSNNIFKNIIGSTCSRNSVVEIDCKLKGTKSVCRETSEDYPHELICSGFRGGRHKTRKQKKRSRRTRRR